MISTPTVFVLGAGSSIPYGFPSGVGLKKSVEDLCQNPQTQREIADCGIDPSDVHRFGIELMLSGLLSVDSFLEHRPEYLPVGKLAIARALVPLEQTELLYQLARQDQHWYAYLLNRIVAERNSFRANALSIVTFNYDRSFEHFLFNSLQTTFGYGDRWEDCAELVRSVPVVHVHGQLAPLPWQDQQRHRVYGPTLGPDELRKAAEGIVIISEMDDHAPTVSAARNLLKQASRIYLLGFGYHPTNLRRLEIRSYTSKLLMGTTFGLGKQEITELVTAHGIRPSPEPYDVLSFLRNVVRFD